ncbi:hypothetical protein Bmeg_05543 [Bacillus megaterium]|nr:hypothetical protein [Priestia megaterium]
MEKETMLLKDNREGIRNKELHQAKKPVSKKVDKKGMLTMSKEKESNKEIQPSQKTEELLFTRKWRLLVTMITAQVKEHHLV